MSYDGFYGDLSNRGTANELLDLAIITKEEIEVLAAEVADNTTLVESSATSAAASAAGAAVSAASASSDAASASASAASALSSQTSASASAAAAAQSAIDALNNSAAALIVAQEAENKADDAVATANAAEATANGIAATANTALTNSNTAISTANAVAADVVVLENRNEYAVATPSSGAVTLDRSNKGYYSVTLTADLTALTLTGAVSAESNELNVMFIQDGTGGWWVTVPTNVTMPKGELSLVSAGAGDKSLVRFISLDNGATWTAEIVSRYIADQNSLPTVVGTNATFNDELTATTGWTPTNGTLSLAGGFMRLTKTSGAGVSSASANKAVTWPATGKDFIIYARIRARNNADTRGALYFLNAPSELALWVGTTNAGADFVPGAVSMSGYSGVKNVASVASGLDYENVAIDYCLQFDSKHGAVTCWFREGDGRWKFKARVLHTWSAAPLAELVLSTAAAAGAWIEADFITICRPNFVAIGDSVCAGSTLFNPNPSLALTNDESTWMRHFTGYSAHRNSLVVNKGVGSDTSALMLNRITDVTETVASVVFLQSSSNDEGAGVSFFSRTHRVQQMINAIKNTGAAVVLLNSMYGTSTYPGNTPDDLLRYGRNWWNNDMLRLTGVDAYYDISIPVQVSNSNNFMASGSSQSDGIHPNPTGYAAIGAYISS